MGKSREKEYIFPIMLNLKTTPSLASVYWSLRLKIIKNVSYSPFPIMKQLKQHWNKTAYETNRKGIQLNGPKVYFSSNVQF